MKNGFVKIGTASPKVTVADCESNLSNILKIHREATKEGVHLLVYPELCLTGCTCGDLFLAKVLQSAAMRCLSEFLSETKESSTISILGFPLVVNDKLYNSAAICQKGQILGIVPTTYVAKDEKRYFSAAPKQTVILSICGQSVPFGTDLIFASDNLPLFRFGVEIGEDLYAPIPASTALCSAGALIVAHPTAVAQIVGADDFHRLMVTSHSARMIAAYASAGCGEGESTTDLVYSGHSLIAENGHVLMERAPFACEKDWQYTEIDLERLSAQRCRQSPHATETLAQEIPFHTEIGETKLTRPIDPHPFIPSDKKECEERCDAILTVQAKGLAQRLTRAYAKTAVIGISGGLDSCLAMLVAAKAMDLLNRPRTDIIDVTMPCFGTTTRTKSNAELLCAELGTQLRCVDIGASVRQHFADIGHEESNHNVVYENAQARERTQVIMDIANMEGGLVVGTGDLSELALGWATYNGDHMSMYGVNAGIPKTLMRYTVSYFADKAEGEGKIKVADVLRDVLNTPVSPELLPPKDGEIAQCTEGIVGPYELHDFFLWYHVRYGASPDKILRLASAAFDGEYDEETIKGWLKVFLRRFFSQQFKRSCLPDGPKVGSVGFSPRGDFNMPSDAVGALWNI